MEYWVVGAFSILGITAAFIHYKRTPPHLRHRIFTRPEPIEERLKSYPLSAGAVIIRANKKRALMHALPYLLVTLTMIGIVKWVGLQPKGECSHVFGINGIYLDILILCYGMPLLFFSISLVSALQGIKGFKGDYFPPLGSVFFQDVIAVRGWRANLWSTIAVLLPLLGIVILSFGHHSYKVFTGDKTMQEYTALVESECH